MNIIALAILVTIIGALPFGLVNLTVLDVSYRDGNRHAMRIANGAAWVEVLFGLVALLAGTLISQNIEENLVIRSLVLMIPAVVGIFFLFKINSPQAHRKVSVPGFFQGAFLNLVSIQVLMFWLLAITYLNTRHLLKVFF